MKLIEGERLDYTLPTVNCNYCRWRAGKLCTHYGAYILSNIHRPTDCPHHAPIEEKEDG